MNSSHRIDSVLSWLGFGILALVLTFAPWCFGAWEMWWFWPGVVGLMASTGVLGLRLLICGGTRIGRGSELRASRLVLPACLAWLVFLAYAGIRAAQSEVFLDAERSILLHTTALLVGLHVLVGLDRPQRRALLTLVVINLFLLGSYGVINHVATGSVKVLWAPGFDQYTIDHRATGSYFCPDHFSGIMELALCLALPLWLDRRSTPVWRGGAALLGVLAVTGILLSKSRGGGLTLVVIAAAAVVWGLSQWPRQVRWYLRGSIICAALAGLLVLWTSDLPYMVRFKNYFGGRALATASLSEKKEIVTHRLRISSRGRMIGGAIRAWQTAPVWGVGAGMHQNIWPHVAASGDGDREKGIWPTLVNDKFHSYEVHSDWIQLLEEYGLVGLILFLIPAGLWFVILLRSLPRETGAHHPTRHPPLFAAPLGGVLAAVAMAFHSLGDFNLQMPATVWLLAALLTLPVTVPKKPPHA